MSKKFTLNQLTEGIRSRNVGQQGARLTEKWSRTGLLRGLENTNRENMAMMLENQAAQLLRESNTMGSGAVGGFTNIAFPIVRRVFGGLVANELVSIQPMSLPSGLLFYLDYTYGTDVGNAYGAGESIYGSGSGRSLQSGADAAGGQYDLVGSGFSAGASGTDTGLTAVTANALYVAGAGSAAEAASFAQAISGFDPLVGDGTLWDVLVVPVGTAADRSSVKSWAFTGLGGTASRVAASVQSGDILAGAAGNGSFNLRRCNVVGDFVVDDAANAATFVANPLSGASVLMLIQRAALATPVTPGAAGVLSYPTVDTLAADALGGLGELDGTPAFEGNMDGTVGAASTVIPEIDIKIESIAVTAQTRKLRARWSPELAQDLNAYHSMDAEVELTQILSEQVALEIDREILNDLLVGANGANLYWSRAPGRFLNKNTGATINPGDDGTAYEGLAFTGTVREWYETLTETIIDVANQIHRKTLRGSANFIVVGPDVATILESGVMYKPNYKLDGQGQVGSSFSIGAEKVGALSNRFTVYKDPYFPRNKILVGFKGGSYLETGYVYAPYVPLIVTPTIFQPDDFTPRKGVMTRYGKKMVRSDFYGTVTILDMHII
jgi:hypothetical protein